MSTAAEPGRSPRREPCEVRCGCGRLMARLTPAGIELKCGRCKRIVVVPAMPQTGWLRVPPR